MSSTGSEDNVAPTLQDTIASLTPRPITVAVNPVALVVTECITVTSAMRKHARWAHSSVAAILGSSSNKTPAVQRRDRAGQGIISAGEQEEVVPSRWGLRGKKGKSLQDNPLMSAFARLRSDLKGCKNIRTFDTPSMLHPFLQVIRSSSTSAPITSLALIAITKFLSYGIISHDSPRLAEAMQQLSSAITHCRFEASDSAADEIVLLRILRLMEVMISGPGGEVLGDESVCEMMETGLSMCCQARLSELLRRSAEIAMVSMCQVIFRRLKTLEIESPEELDALDEELDRENDQDGPKMDPTTNGEGDYAQHKVEAPQQSSSSEKGPDDNDSMANPASSTVDLPATAADGEPQAAVEIRPYSLPSIRELFRVLVELLDPHDRQHTDTMRVMALRIVDVALEVAGPSIASHPSLANLAKDTLCRHIFQLVRSDNMAVLNESLRVAGTLLATCRNVLKLQQELYLSYLVACLFPRVEIPMEPGIEPSLYEGVPQAPSLIKQPPQQDSSSGRSTPVPVKDRQKLGLEGGARKPDAREAMIENLGGLVRIPSFMAELFVNYDCEIDRGDVCMDIVGLLSRNAFPDSATWSTVNVPPLCLDALLGFVQSIADRLDEEPVTEGFPTADSLREQRARKKIIIKGATKFNEKPKAGIAFLASQGIIKDSEDPKCIAEFVKGTTRVDKKVLGEFLSKKGNEAILSAFINLFDFKGLRLDEALRQLLHAFRLPGESALIERIVTDFAEQYLEKAQPEGITSKDAIFVLTYAIIMLNTDQHNPNLKGNKRMAYEDFARNLRGVNDGKDFDPDYLHAMYDSIKTREIILPEEHSDRNAYEHAWKELLVKCQTTPDLIICDTNIYDADMFAATWKPIVATLSYVFMSATDDAVFSRVVLGFDQCAQIAAKYNLTDALDRIISCLAYISTLAPDVPPSTSLNTEVQADKKSVMVSETAVRFGRDGRAQLATVVLFQVIKGHEASIRDGWNHLIRIMVNLFVNSLIPPYFLSFQKTLALPPIPLQNPAQIIDRPERPADTGIFSALSSYVSSFANDEPPEPSDQEIEYTLCTVDTVKECHFEDILANISQLPVEALRSLLTSLLAHIPEDGSPRVIVVKPELPGASPRTGAPRQKGKGPIYDPSLVFVLELATVLALRNDETVRELAKDVTDALSTVIRDASKHHYVVIARSVYYLLSLLNASNDYDFIRAPVLLHTFSSFSDALLQECAQPILKGLTDCCKGPNALRSELTGSPDFWTILNRLSNVPEAAGDVFQLVEDLTTSSQPGITADNYEAAIALLNEFATAAQVGARDEQLYDQAAKRGKGPKPKKPESNEIVVRGSKAMTIVFQLSSRVPHFIEQSHLETTEAWTAYWSPILKTLAHQCLNPCREIRQQAFSAMQRTLLSNSLASPDHAEWTAIFSEVLVPLITQLLKPEVYQSDPLGMSETRVRASTLLSKVFLHYLVLLSGTSELLDLWLKIITIMDRLMNSGQGDNLEEAVVENLKNMLLVLSSGGYLAPPDENPQREELWNETWKRINRFQPNLLQELFPTDATKPVRQRVSPDEKAGGEVAPEADVAVTPQSEAEGEKGGDEGGGEENVQDTVQEHVEEKQEAGEKEG
ncbi:similar to guanine nucleotide exchange factor (Gea2) [Plenodomus lingam JN3]|uniref:Similar to guanine nucleotide exchange factor (Gea2) n=1 Tax=Leptosphaeria maculans (strain JN3 / isolate v23.1.3 / race Av1-4-5-6-7-8) TaxID=985895 RepID=E4ZRW4_LEPMJ|nr:similar to guanine nucleotide exchange factor (Gea2) [Plenodomus lingam JN3]CBX93961.1 similar to guanine nucleotide exchange factor (Gea2) [Plenodomus lingam JN3]